MTTVPNSARYPKDALRPIDGWDWRRPTGTYGHPGYGEPHTTSDTTHTLFARANGMTAEEFDAFLAEDEFGHEPCDQPTAERIADDQAEALEINAQIDALAAEIDLRTARIRRNLSDDLDFGDVTDVYDV